MMRFLLPCSFCNELEGILAKFWWQRGVDKRGIHWCSCARLSELKEDGEMGFKDLAKFNVALLAKQGWRILMHPTSLMARILRAKYFSNTSFLNARLGSHPLMVWRSIWSSKKLIEMGLKWQVGLSNDIRIWEDCWVPKSIPSRVHAPRVGFVERVSELIWVDGIRWNWDLVDSLFGMEEATLIKGIPLPSVPQPDTVVWGGKRSGEYTVQSGYRILLQSSKMRYTGHEVFKLLWNVRCPSKF